MRKKLKSLVLVMCVLVSFADLVLARDGIATQRVQFKPGASSATAEEVIKEDVACDYVVGAKAGQTMSVKLATKDNLYFNVLAPNSEEAIFQGQMAEDSEKWSGELPADGDYRIRVYAMGDAKKGSHNFTCTISIK